MVHPHHRPSGPVLVVAAAGYGKTATLAAELPPAGQLRPAATLMDGPLPTVAWLGVDDLDQLGPADRAVLLSRLAKLPGEFTLRIASREPLGPDSQRLLPGLRELGPTDVALGAPAIARLLNDGYGISDPEAAVRVHLLTCGWPTLVHVAGDVLSRRPDVPPGDLLIDAATAAAGWLELEVLPAIPEATRQVLGVIGDLGPVTTRLHDRVAQALGMHAAHGAVDDLRDTGVLVPRRLLDGEREQLTTVPLVAQVLSTGLTAPGARGAPDPALLAAVAAAYEAEGFPLPAARAHARAGRHADVERLLDQHGAELLRRGEAATVADLLGRLPCLDSRPGLRSTYAEALRLGGDAAGARRALAPLVEAAGAGNWPTGLATQVAAVHYLAADHPAALAALDQACPDPSGSAEVIEWSATRVHVLCTLGRAEEATGLARQTLDLAERDGGGLLMASAHLAMARTSTGPAKEAHHELALRSATRAGDALTASRAQVNQSCLLLAAARYREAVIAAREAVRLAGSGSPTGRFAAALHNLGEALTRVGEFDEAMWRLRQGTALCRRLGAGRAVGLLGIADLHRELGHRERSQAAYQEAVAVARAAHEPQVLVPALAGLARVQLDDPGTAMSLVEEAERIATPALLPFALLARGWVELARGAQERGATSARSAVAAARSVQAIDLVAEALELTAATAFDPETARAALTEARSIWHEGGAGPAVARVEVLLGRLDHADGTSRSRAREAARHLQRLGIDRVHGRPVADTAPGQRVELRVLGGFEVRLDGVPVPLPVWRSRQARTLVKVLAAHRGIPVTRAYLCELLWPDDDPAKTGHRLSVLLATVRGVLDSERERPQDYYLAADQRGIWLDLRHVDLDADRLLRDASLAAELMDTGDGTRAREILGDIESRYPGDAFAEEPYELWADGLREEVRASWQRSMRRLATLHSREGRVADAQVLLVRLLAADPYDAPLHKLLVRTLDRAGRHGEAQRAFHRWEAAMNDIGAPPPDGELLAAPVLTPR